MTNRKTLSMLWGSLGLAVGLVSGISCTWAVTRAVRSLRIPTRVVWSLIAATCFAVSLLSAYIGGVLVRYPVRRRVYSRNVDWLARRQGVPVTRSDARRSDEIGRLIVLSGLDGAGKSSHIDWIEHALEERGVRYRPVQLRWAALSGVPLLGIAKILGYTSRVLNPRSKTYVVEHRYHEWAPMRRLWPLLFTLDMMILAQRYALRPLRNGDWVLCDRYVMDGIVDMAASLHDPQFIHSIFARRLLSLIPPEARIVVLTVQPAIAFERKADVLDESYLQTRHALFIDIAQQVGAVIVDGDRPFADVQVEIAHVIGIEPLDADKGVLHEIEAAVRPRSVARHTLSVVLDLVRSYRRNWSAGPRT